MENGYSPFCSFHGVPVLGWYIQEGTLVAILLLVSEGRGTLMWMGSVAWIVAPSFSYSCTLTTASAVSSIHPMSTPKQQSTYPLELYFYQLYIRPHHHKYYSTIDQNYCVVLLA